MKFENKTKEAIKVKKEGTEPPAFVTVYPESIKSKEGENALVYSIETESVLFTDAYKKVGLTLMSGGTKKVKVSEPELVEAVESKAGTEKVETKVVKKKSIFEKFKGRK